MRIKLDGYIYFTCVEVLFKLFFIKDWIIITVIINGYFFLIPQVTSLDRFCCLFQLGPEKGVIHLATAAIVNALWDLWAKMENKVERTTCTFIHITYNNLFDGYQLFLLF